MTWFGELPKGWTEKRAKYLFKEVDERSETGEEELLSVSHITGVTPRSHKNVTMFMAESNVGLKICRPGDLVINTMWAWMSAMGVSTYSGVVSPSYHVYRPIDPNVFSKKYLDHLLRIEAYRTEYTRRSTGINASRLRLYPDQFLNIKFICPPRAAQDQIVRYLDWKVSQINKLINAKRRQIGLLQEEIDVLTNQSISEAKNKSRLKVLVDVIREWIVRDDTILYSPVGVLNRGRGIFHKEALRGSDLGDSEFFKVEPNTLMFSGQFAWEGAVALTSDTENGCIASHRYYTVRGKRNLFETGYLWAFFQTRYGDMLLNTCSHGAAGRNKPLNFNELMNEYIPVPSFETQTSITQNVRLFIALRDKTKLYEQFINEYRTRLISDVITGKLDVRGVIVPEYEAVENVIEYPEKLDKELCDAEEYI